MDNKAKSNRRILYLLKILLEKTDDAHSISIKKIEEELKTYDISVERKTLYKDIHFLNDFGVDVIMENYGRDRLYHIGERDFELPELKLLVDLVQSSKFITEKKSNTLIKKIEGLTSVYEGKQLQRQVFVSGRIKAENESIYYNVDKIHSAIGTDVKIVFQYFQWSVDKEKVLRHDGKVYVVSPWALTWDNEKYYLLAYDEETESIRHYRVDKMLNIDLKQEQRAGQDCFNSFDLAKYTNKLFEMFDGDNVVVKLRVKNDFAGIIIDRFGTDIDITIVDKEWFEVGVEAALSEQFIGWIISLGDNVVIVEPEEAVTRIKEVGKRIRKMYGG